MKGLNLDRSVSTLDMTREQWLKHRQSGIGGSDAGAVCGLNPFVTSIHVWLNKTGQSEDNYDNEAMRQGRDLEPYVAKRFMESTGKKVRRCNRLLRHPDYDFMIANVDRLVDGENAGLECKTASPYSSGRWKDGIPEWYELQCHHYMAVTGADHWYIACLIYGQELIIRRIERDEEVIKNLISIESDFWDNYVETNTMPPADGSSAAKEILDKYYPESDGESIELFGDFDQKLQIREKLIEQIDELKGDVEKIDQEIKQEMETAEIGLTDHYKITWKSITSNRLDSKKLKADHPDIYDQYTKQSSSRRYTVKALSA